jgi:hypothetical protein
MSHLTKPAGVRSDPARASVRSVPRDTPAALGSNTLMEDCLTRSRMLVAALLIAASFGLGVPARADEDSVDMQVTAYDKLPAGAKFGIERTENTELSTYVQGHLKDALERHGFSYGKSARLVMTVAVEKIGNERPPDASFDQDNSQIHVAIDNGQPPLDSQIGHQFRISIDLYDRRSGQYVWRGHITNMKPGVDPFAATKPMIERLVDSMASGTATGH